MYTAINHITFLEQNNLNKYILKLFCFVNVKVWANQCLTVTIKSPYVITYVCQNFGICDVRGKITKSINQASYLLPSDFPKNFPKLVLIYIG